MKCNHIEMFFIYTYTYIKLQIFIHYRLLYALYTKTYSWSRKIIYKIGQNINIYVYQNVCVYKSGYDKNIFYNRKTKKIFMKNAEYLHPPFFSVHLWIYRSFTDLENHMPSEFLRYPSPHRFNLERAVSNPRHTSGSSPDVWKRPE